MTRSSRPFTWLLAASLSFAGFASTAHAGVITTAELAAPAASQDAARAQVQAALERADVVAGLQARGVSVEEVQARVNAMSDAEAAWMAQQMDTAPAGAGDIIGTLVFIFVLLLVTDILGLTKVFPFTRSVR
ncbi:PA2779 family protein [Ideonella margarita]|uniref:PA2779 family protein n=1 Tax=Ideonella margarita TaxID=2984191 RepID=A0ABU9C1L5_9BURK